MSPSENPGAADIFSVEELAPEALSSEVLSSQSLPDEDYDDGQGCYSLGSSSATTSTSNAIVNRIIRVLVTAKEERTVRFTDVDPVTAEEVVRFLDAQYERRRLMYDIPP